MTRPKKTFFTRTRYYVTTFWHTTTTICYVFLRWLWLLLKSDDAKVFDATSRRSLIFLTNWATARLIWVSGHADATRPYGLLVRGVSTRMPPVGLNANLAKPRPSRFSSSALITFSVIMNYKCWLRMVACAHILHNSLARHYHLYILVRANRTCLFDIILISILSQSLVEDLFSFVIADMKIFTKNTVNVFGDYGGGRCQTHYHICLYFFVAFLHCFLSLYRLIKHILRQPKWPPLKIPEIQKNQIQKRNQRFFFSSCLVGAPSALCLLVVPVVV